MQCLRVPWHWLTQWVSGSWDFSIGFRILNHPSLFQPVPASSRTHFPTRPNTQVNPSFSFFKIQQYFTFPRRGSNPQPLYHEPFSIPRHQRFSRQSTGSMFYKYQLAIVIDHEDVMALLQHCIHLVMQQCHRFWQIRGMVLLFSEINDGIIINYYSLLEQFSFFSHL